jgi:hypothetical protein
VGDRGITADGFATPESYHLNRFQDLADADVGSEYARSVPAERPKLTGISAFGFGIEWDWVLTDSKIVHRLVIFLEDRRALTYDHYREDVGYVVESVLKIRTQLTEILQELAPDSGACRSVYALRAACRRFLDRVDGKSGWGSNPEFFVALGEMRGVFALYVRTLVEQYRITVHGPLRRLLEDAQLHDEDPLSPGYSI